MFCNCGFQCAWQEVHLQMIEFENKVFDSYNDYHRHQTQQHNSFQLFGYNRLNSSVVYVTDHIHPHKEFEFDSIQYLAWTTSVKLDVFQVLNLINLKQSI